MFVPSVNFIGELSKQVISPQQAQHIHTKLMFPLTPTVWKIRVCGKPDLNVSEVFDHTAVIPAHS